MFCNSNLPETRDGRLIQANPWGPWAPVATLPMPNAPMGASYTTWRDTSQGNADAENNLGAMYYNGQGVLQDNVYAHIWWSIAASNGAGDAVKNRDIAAKRMTTEQVAQAQKLARECVKKNYKGC